MLQSWNWKKLWYIYVHFLGTNKKFILSDVLKYRSLCGKVQDSVVNLQDFEFCYFNQMKRI